MKNIEDITIEDMTMTSIGDSMYVAEELVYEAGNVAVDILCNLSQLEKDFDLLLFEAELFIKHYKEDTDFFVGLTDVEFYADKSAMVNKIVKSISYKQTALARLASEIEKAKDKIENMGIRHEKEVG